MELIESTEPSIYMRFHETLDKAIKFIKQLYNGATCKITGMSLLEKAIIIAGLTEQISSQGYLDYHIMWLVGVLFQFYNYRPQIYEENIDQILSSLKDQEKNQIKTYIKQINIGSNLPKGQGYKAILQQINQLDIIPCYILIFEFYTLCRLWDDGRLKKVPENSVQFACYSYIFWYRAISKHMSIGKNIKQYIKDFFKKLQDKLGTIAQIRKKAEPLYSVE